MINDPATGRRQEDSSGVDGHKPMLHLILDELREQNKHLKALVKQGKEKRK